MTGAEHEGTLDTLPVFDDHHGRPEVWSGLRMEGLVQKPCVFHEKDLAELTQRGMTEDFRCLEGWAVPDQDWDGVPLSILLEIAEPMPDAKYAAISAADYSVTVPLDADVSNILLATRLNGFPLTEEHGGPCRLIAVDQACYASIKWVDRIRLTEEMPKETAQELAGARNASRGSTTP